MTRADSPNIVLVTCDQLRAFEIGCYGNEVIRTPNIDQLAATGARFETAVTNCPVCMPARSTLLSGQYPRTCTGSLGNAHDWLQDAQRWTMAQYPTRGRPHLPAPTLPEALREAGYHTSVIGKWHIHSWPDEIGFDDYLIPRVYHCHSGQNYTHNGRPEFVPAQWSVDFEAERAGETLRERAGEKHPFFMFYNISPPHCPVADAPDRYLRMYDPAEIPLRENVPIGEDGALPADEEAFRVYRWDFKYYEHRLPHTLQLPDNYDLRSFIAEYYGLTTWVDDTIGQLMENLDASGLAENTIVVFVSDHGDMLGSHGAWQKGSLLEEALRIPMIVRWPEGIEPTTVTDHVGSLVDVAPSLLGLTGHRPPRHMQGRDMSKTLRGERSDVDAHAFIETQGDGVAIRTPRHLYGVPWAQERPALADTPHRFHDLAENPYQLDDLVMTGAQANVARELDSLLREWHRATPWMTS